MSEPPAVHPKSRGPARRAQRRGPTIDDVAEVAGVSRGTVSRVLNGGHYVSPTALEAVRRAVRTTGYVVNQSARSLVTRRTNTFAFVLSEPQERLFEDPNFNVLLRACTQALGEVDGNLVLMLAGTQAARARALRFIHAGHVDGVLLVSTHGSDPIFAELQASKVPAVSCGRALDDRVSVPYVSADDRGGARLMTRHLVDRGRGRIATITGPLDTPGGVERLQGFEDVVGRVPRRLVVSASDYSHAAGEVAMATLLDRSPDLDGVFVASDLLAAGAMATLRRAGRSVPLDVAVGGFDDSPVALTTEPALTTVRQRLDVIGEHMVRILLDLLESRQGVNIVVPTELVVRAST